MEYIIEKLEGEAKLIVEWNDGKIINGQIEFFNYRGVEEILTNKPILDSLVITPRVCGVCNVAHLLANTLAIEDIYNHTSPITLSQKAKDIRTLVLKLEAIQNHIKWFYLSLLPHIYKINNETLQKAKHFEALTQTSTINKIIATFAGQWPHSSFIVPGGVVCEANCFDVAMAIGFFSSIKIFVSKIVGYSVEDFLGISTISQILSKESDFATFIKIAKKLKLKHIAKGQNKYIILGLDNPIYISKHKINEANINDIVEYSSIGSAKGVLYNGTHYETSPLAREIHRQNPLIMTLLKSYKDTPFVRIIARIAELVRYTKDVEILLQHLDTLEPSYIKPKANIEDISGVGVGLVEASRGSLLHKLSVSNNTINSYQIITPTQWNLSNSTGTSNSLLQDSIVGLSDIEYAKLLLYSLDVCSVCTTQ